MLDCLLLGLVTFALGALGMGPMQCELPVLVTLQAAFLMHRLATAVTVQQKTNKEHNFRALATSLFALCLSGQISACV